MFCYSESSELNCEIHDFNKIENWAEWKLSLAFYHENQ